MLLDAANRVIACSKGRGLLTEIYDLRDHGQPQGHYRDGRGRSVALHVTPGYETYRGLGWRGEVAPKMTGQGLTLMEVCAYDRPYGEF